MSIVFGQRISTILFCGKIGSVLRIWMSCLNATGDRIIDGLESSTKFINIWMLLCLRSMCLRSTFLERIKGWNSGFVLLSFVSIHQNGNFDFFSSMAVLRRLKVSANGVNEGKHKQNIYTRTHTNTYWECVNRFRAVKSNVRWKSEWACVSDADYWTIIYLCWCSFSRSNSKQQDELHAPDLMSQYFYGNGWIYKASKLK